MSNNGNQRNQSTESSESKRGRDRGDLDLAGAEYDAPPCDAGRFCTEPGEYEATHKRGAVTVTRHYCRTHARAVGVDVDE